MINRALQRSHTDDNHLKKFFHPSTEFKNKTRTHQPRTGRYRVYNTHLHGNRIPNRLGTSFPNTGNRIPSRREQDSRQPHPDSFQNGIRKALTDSIAPVYPWLFQHIPAACILQRRIPAESFLSMEGRRHHKPVFTPRLFS